jgi:hypothetical protein
MAFGTTYGEENFIQMYGFGIFELNSSAVQIGTVGVNFYLIYALKSPSNSAPKCPVSKCRYAMEKREKICLI